MVQTNAKPFDEWPEWMKVAYARAVEAEMERGRERARKENELLRVLAEAREYAAARGQNG